MKTAYAQYRSYAIIVITMFALVLISQLQFINPKAVEKQNDMEVPGNFNVHVFWQKGPIDVDLWLSSPGDAEPVGYPRQSGLVWNLLRDDLGTSSDPTDLNFETAFSRGIPAGEYVVNIHCYTCRAPVEVTVELDIKTNGSNKKLAVSTVKLSPNQERTVFRFRMNDKQELVEGSMTNLYKPLRGIMR